MTTDEVEVDLFQLASNRRAGPLGACSRSSVLHLDEVGLPTRAIPVALLFFNVGVEIGQLAGAERILENPRRCDFDPQVLECKNEDSSACLTPAQVDVIRRLYTPLVNPRTKNEIFPGIERGSELLWGDPAGTGSMVAQAARRVDDFGGGYGKGQWFRNAVFQDAKWDYRTFTTRAFWILSVALGSSRTLIDYS